MIMEAETEGYTSGLTDATGHHRCHHQRGQEVVTRGLKGSGPANLTALAPE